MFFIIFSLQKVDSAGKPYNTFSLSIGLVCTRCTGDLERERDFDFDFDFDFERERFLLSLLSLSAMLKTCKL